MGKGRITYVGFWPDAATLAKLSAGWLKDAAVEPLIPSAPEGVEVCERAGSDKRVFVIINHTTKTQSVSLPAEMTDLLKGGSVRSVSLEKYGVAVVESAAK